MGITSQIFAKPNPEYYSGFGFESPRVLSFFDKLISYIFSSGVAWPSGEADAVSIYFDTGVNAIGISLRTEYGFLGPSVEIRYSEGDDIGSELIPFKGQASTESWLRASYEKLIEIQMTKNVPIVFPPLDDSLFALESDIPANPVVSEGGWD